MEKLTDLQSQALIPIFSSKDGHTSVKQRMLLDSEMSGCIIFTVVGDADVRKCRQISPVTLIEKSI